jgi:hypothetical protein
MLVLVFEFTLFENSFKVEGKAHDRKFAFDCVMRQDALQEDVFENSGVKRLIDMSIEGYNDFLCAYISVQTQNLKFKYKIFIDTQQRVLLMVKLAAVKHIR